MRLSLTKRKENEKGTFIFPLANSEYINTVHIHFMVCATCLYMDF